MTQDEVREHLRGLVQEFAPGLALTVLERRDYDLQHELASRINAAVELLAAFNKEAQENPGVDGIVLLKSLDGKLAAARAMVPEESRGPSIWELVQRPAL